MHLFFTLFSIYFNSKNCIVNDGSSPIPTSSFYGSTTLVTDTINELTKTTR